MMAPASMAQPPTVIGVGGMITLNGVPVENGTSVIVKNNDTGTYDNATTENGWYASSMTAKDGDIISVMVCYSGKNYWNTTIVDTSHITQFCNISISVESGIVANAGGHYYGREGENINLDASGSTGDITSYTWECNGVVKHGISVSYALDNGEYNATLTVSDGVTQDVDTAAITVYNVPPSADAGDMYFGDAGEEIIFYGGNSSDVYDDLLYRWDFDGDGIWDTEWSNSSNATHVYTASGIYTVILNVTDGDACDINTALAVISNSDNDMPVANFTYDVDNLTLSFIDGSYDPDGYIVKWSWQFGDGTTSSNQNPTHVYSDYGSYNVTLRIEDDKGAVNYMTKEITLINDIEVNLKPVANFTIEGLLLENHTIYMNSTSYDPDGVIVNSTWLVDGDELYNTSIEMQFSEGRHNITLMVTDDDNANDTMTKTIDVEKENISNNTNSYNLTVYVMYDDSPIQGANITISDNVVQTGNDGKAVISLEGGWYTVSIEKDGYKPKIEQVHLTGDRTLNVALDKGRNMPLSMATLIIALLIALWRKGRKYEKNH